MNFKLVPTICPYCGSYLAEKDGKVTGVKPWKIHPADHQYRKFDLVHDHKRSMAPVFSQDKTAFFIANGLIIFKTVPGCAT